VFTHTHDPRYLVAHDEPIPAGVTDSEVLMAKSFRIESSGADETADDYDDGGILVNVLPPLLAPTSSDSRRDAAFFAPMCPLFNLVQAFVKKSSGGSLEDIDALLGCGMWRSVLHVASCSTLSCQPAEPSQLLPTPPPQLVCTHWQYTPISTSFT
jgi:hypothetical protein